MRTVYIFCVTLLQFTTVFSQNQNSTNTTNTTSTTLTTTILTTLTTRTTTTPKTTKKAPPRIPLVPDSHHVIINSNKKNDNDDHHGHHHDGYDGHDDRYWGSGMSGHRLAGLVNRNAYLNYVRKQQQLRYLWPRPLHNFYWG